MPLFRACSRLGHHAPLIGVSFSLSAVRTLRSECHRKHAPGVDLTRLYLYRSQKTQVA